MAWLNIFKHKNIIPPTFNLQPVSYFEEQLISRQNQQTQNNAFAYQQGQARAAQNNAWRWYEQQAMVDDASQARARAIDSMYGNGYMESMKEARKELELIVSEDKPRRKGGRYRFMSENN